MGEGYGRGICGRHRLSYLTESACCRNILCVGWVDGEGGLGLGLGAPDPVPDAPTFRWCHRLPCVPADKQCRCAMRPAEGRLRLECGLREPSIQRRLPLKFGCTEHTYIKNILSKVEVVRWSMVITSSMNTKTKISVGISEPNQKWRKSAWVRFNRVRVATGFL